MSYFQKHYYCQFPASSLSLLSKSFVNIIFLWTRKQQITKARQLFIFSYTLPPEKYFIKLCNKITVCSIKMYHFDYCNVRQKYQNCNILQKIQKHDFQCRVIQKAFVLVLIIIPSLQCASKKNIFFKRFSLKLSS